MQNVNGDLHGLLARLNAGPANGIDVFTLNICKQMADGSLQNTPTIYLYVQQGHSLFAQVSVYQSVNTWAYLRLGNELPVSFDNGAVNETVQRARLDRWAALRDPRGGRVIYLEVLSPLPEVVMTGQTATTARPRPSSVPTPRPSRTH